MRETVLLTKHEMRMVEQRSATLNYTVIKRRRFNLDRRL